MSEKSTPCGCGSCQCGKTKPSDEARPSRFGWFSSRMGQATTKGLGGSALTAMIFTPCPCCGGVLVACLRGLLSAAIGLGVGLVAYKHPFKRPKTGQPVRTPTAALETE